MLQTLPPIPLFDLRLIAVPGDTQNLVVILRLAPLQRRLRLLQLRLQRLDVSITRGAFRSRLLYGRFEVRYGCVVRFERELNSGARAEGFERVGSEG